MNENDAYIFDVESPRDWILSSEPVWVAGWFLSKTKAIFSDIRAVINDRHYLGILGLPRTEIEQRHRGWVGLPHAGFVLLINPPAGAHTLRLELLDAGHHWVEFWRTEIKVTGGQSKPPRYRLGVLPDHCHRLLQQQRAEPDADPLALAESLVMEGAAIPLDTLPNPPFFGALEKPELVGGTQYGKLRVEGWILHQERRIVRLLGSTHPNVENELDYGNRPRADVSASFPGYPNSSFPQYFGMLDIDEAAPGPAVIKLFAELDDGSRHLVFARRFYPRVCTVWEHPLPEFSRRKLLGCVSILARAAFTHGITIGSLKELWQAWRKSTQLFRQDAPATIPLRPLASDPYKDWVTTNQLTPRLRELLIAAAAKLPPSGHTFVLLIDGLGCTAEQIAALRSSLAAQIYPNWEARIIDGPPGTTGDQRVIIEPTLPGESRIQRLNAAAHKSTADLMALLPGHARLSPDALLEVAERFSSTSQLELAYTDEDRMDASGQRSAPDFKPEWSPALSLSGLFPGNLAVIRRDQFVSLGSFRADYPTVPWYDLLLRLSDNLMPAQVAHIPIVCYHAWSGHPLTVELCDPSYEEARVALSDTLKRRGWDAAPFLPESGHVQRVRYSQLRWSPSILAQMPVTIVIPTRDRLHLLQECIELLEETIDWRHVRLVIVDDHSRDTDALRYLAQIEMRTDLRCSVVRLTDPHAPFNYSRLVNAALPKIETPLILHLNNDVNALEPGWLESMVGWFSDPEVAVVGAKLVYPDRSLNHTGILIGPHGGLADTAFARADPSSVPIRWHDTVREVSAVTGACLLTRTDLYREIGGFDEYDFGVAYNDVDYCLRVRSRGQRVLYVPQAKLMHWGSATRGVTFDEAEHIAWLKRYPSYSDPYLSRHWHLQDNILRCHVQATSRTSRVKSLRLLLLTHNLNLEGAPLFLLEYAGWMARQEGFQLEVLASQDGPLREAFASLGARIRLLNPQPLYASATDADFRREIGAIAARIDWTGIDLVVCNTLVSFWGVHLARLAGKPSLFYIHESTSVFRFFEPHLALGLHKFVHSALAEATRTLFLCTATEAYYSDDNQHGNYRIVPSWIQLDAIDRFRTEHSRAAMRRKHGLGDDEVIIANIGTVCERKGQHIFLRTIAHFNRWYRRELPVRFLLVGARPGIYLDLLRRDLANLGLTNVILIPETREAFDFFVASDVFVCSSFEESFPRVVMEAMAFGTPVVSTDVHGIKDLIGQRQDGYLVAPGEPEAFARMLHTCLAKERSGKSLAPTARSRVMRGHDSRRILPHHADLAREAWLADNR